MPVLLFEGQKIDYNERPGSPQESFSGDVFRAKRVFDVPWDLRWPFIKYMVGDAWLTGWGGAKSGTWIKRSLPHKYYAKGAGKISRPFMIATALESVEGLGQQNTSLAADFELYNTGYMIARVTIAYESVTYNVVSDREAGETEYSLKRFITVFRQPTAEFLTLPQGAYKWVEMDPNRVGSVLFDKAELARGRKVPCGVRVVGSNGKIVAAQEIVIVHHRVPGVPRAVNTHIGCVNLYNWDSLRVKQGQLLLANIEIKPYKWLTGKRLFDLTFKFKFLDPDPVNSLKFANEPRGHNWFLQYFPVDTTALDISSVDSLLAGKPEYKLITHNGYPPYSHFGALAGKTVYNYKDMRELFTNYDGDFVVDDERD